MVFSSHVADRNHLDFTDKVVTKMSLNMKSVVILDVASDMPRVDTRWQVEGLCHLVVNFSSAVGFIVFSVDDDFSTLNFHAHLLWHVSSDRETVVKGISGVWSSRYD